MSCATNRRLFEKARITGLNWPKAKAIMRDEQIGTARLTSGWGFVPLQSQGGKFAMCAILYIDENLFVWLLAKPAMHNTGKK